MTVINSGIRRNSESIEFQSNIKKGMLKTVENLNIFKIAFRSHAIFFSYSNEFVIKLVEALSGNYVPLEPSKNFHRFYSIWIALLEHSSPEKVQYAVWEEKLKF